MSRTNTYLRQLPPGLTHIDVYWVLRLFNVTDPCAQHAVKKLLADGSGDKDRAENMREAWETLDRWREMEREQELRGRQAFDLDEFARQWSARAQASGALAIPDVRQEQVRERHDFSQLTPLVRTTTDTPGTPCCWTHAADWQRQRFIVCEVCGNKRCPHATDCSLDCTGSNEPGQPGSRFADALPDPAGQLGDYGACGVDEADPLTMQADGTYEQPDQRPPDRPLASHCPDGGACKHKCGLEPCKEPCKEPSE